MEGCVDHVHEPSTVVLCFGLGHAEKATGYREKIPSFSILGMFLCLEILLANENACYVYFSYLCYHTLNTEAVCAQ